MKWLIRFLTIIFIATSATQSSAITINKSNCENPIYKKQNPDKCPSTHWNFATSGVAAVGSGAAILGGVLAIMGLSNSSSGGGGDGAAPMPTLPSYDRVGGDIDSVHLASIINDAKYYENFNQYNEIRLAWSLARGFTGKNSTIAILDAGDDTWHGSTVAAIAGGPIAPDATIQTYKITDKYDEFLSYGQIGDIIRATDNADIFNASWSVEMRANQIYSREQIIRLTDANFISALAQSANRGAIFIWAAGNDYDKRQSSALSALPRVVNELQGHFINVVAWDDQTQSLADFSNACGVTQDYCITAPGTNISTGDTIADGTSFAAPIVSAAVAVLREAFPYMTAPQITELLFETARDLGRPGVDEIYGHGMLDLERATRPVGAALVPIDGGLMMQPLRTARVAGPIAHKIHSANIRFAFFDRYGRAFESNLNNNVKIQNRSRGLERLRAENAIKMSVGKIELGQRKTDFLTADSFLKTDGQNTVTFIAANNSFDINGITFTQRTSIGTMRPRPTPESMITDISAVTTASIELGMQIGEWSFGVGAMDGVLGGNMSMRVPAARMADGRILFNDHNINLTTAPAMEYSIGYKFLTAAFVDNPYGTDEIYFLAKTKIRF